MASQIIGRALGSVVSPIVEYIDVDGVIRRIDVEDVLHRIDFDALLDRIDIDRLIDRVDVNRQLERVDVDALMARVDINGIVDRSNISAIVARSSSGVFGHIFDALRAQIAVVDQFFQRLGHCACCFRSRPPLLPPAPRNRKSRRERDPPVPKRRSEFAVLIQGRYAWLFSRSIAWLIDQFIVAVSFGVALALIQIPVRVVIDDSDWSLDGWWLIPIIFAVWGYLYSACSLAATGRTIAMAIIGLKLVQIDGSRVLIVQAFLRTLVMPFSFAFFGIGILIGWLRRDGRQLQDLVTFTGIVYSWDAKMARLREEAYNDLELNEPTEELADDE